MNTITKTILVPMVRHGLTFLCGWLMAKGLVDSHDVEQIMSNVNVIAGILGAILTTGWSIWEKRKKGAPPVVPAAIALFLVCMLTGCESTNASTSHLRATDGTKMMDIEFPKELDATKFKAEVDLQKGKLKIEADTIKTKNVETIQAMGAREKANIKATSDLAGKVAEGVTKGAVKGAKESLLPGAP